MTELHQQNVPTYIRVGKLADPEGNSIAVYLHSRCGCLVPDTGVLAHNSMCQGERGTALELEQVQSRSEPVRNGLESCLQRECLVCHHQACGWCPECHPEVPDL